MSTMTDEAVEVDVDLDLPLTCSWQDGCDREAAWVSTTSCACQQQEQLCREHREVVMQYIAQAQLAGLLVLHVKCGRGITLSWRPL